MAGAAELLVCVGPQALARQLAAAELAQRSGYSATASGATAICDQSDAASPPRNPAGVRRGARSREPLDALREVGEESQRVAVGPVAVVDQTSSGARSARLTTSQYRLCSASKPTSSTAGGRSSGSNSRVAGPPRRRTARHARAAPDHRLEQLTHNAERERLLELRAARLEGDHAVARPPRAPRASARSCRRRPGPRSGAASRRRRTRDPALRAASPARARARGDPRLWRTAPPTIHREPRRARTKPRGNLGDPPLCARAGAETITADEDGERTQQAQDPSCSSKRSGTRGGWS